MSTPVSTVSNSNVQIKLAILPAGSFVKPADTAFKTLTASNDISISFDDQTVEVDSYGSGLAKQSSKVGTMFKADLNGIVQSTDEAYKTILMPLGGTSDDAVKNCFYVITAGNGDTFEGAAQISGLKLNLKTRDIYRYSFTLNGQGDCAWTAFVATP